MTQRVSLRGGHDTALKQLEGPRLSHWELEQKGVRENRRSDLVDIAAQETGFTEVKLHGELTRACFQLRFFGEVLREGSYLEATIDPAGDTPMGLGRICGDYWYPWAR